MENELEKLPAENDGKIKAESDIRTPNLVLNRIQLQTIFPPEFGKFIPFFSKFNLFGQNLARARKK